MIGTPLIRETTATAVTPVRQGPSRTFRPPVLIEVPTLPSTGPKPSRKAARPRVSPDRPRRRLRKEVRVAVVSIALGVALGSLAVFAIRSSGGSIDDEPDRPDSVAAPFSIELEPPIPEPSEFLDPDPQIDLLPVAFPGLLPGEDDVDEEYGHARP